MVTDIGAVGFAYGSPRLISRTGPAQSWLKRLRHRIADRIQTVLPGATGGVANAILTGTKGHIPVEDADHLRDAGLAHLLVVAGMHMGFVAGFVFLLVRGGCALIPAIALRHPTKKWAAFATIVACLIYLVLTGAAPPTQRAFVMILMVMTATLLDRRAFSMRMLALAAMIVLIVEPEAVTGPSFQMSFAAVGCLVAAFFASYFAITLLYLLLGTLWAAARVLGNDTVAGHALQGRQTPRARSAARAAPERIGRSGRRALRNR